MAIYEIKGSSYELSDGLQGADLTKALQQLSDLPNQSSPLAPPAVTPKAPIGAHKPDALAYLAETDAILGYPKGTSAAQIQQESSFNSNPPDAGKGAKGIAQVMPSTLAALQKRYGRTFDLTNDKDSLFLHRALMVENKAKFGTVQDALRAYNSGWDKTLWNNPETNNYISKILGVNTAQAAPPPPPAAPVTPATQAVDAYAEAKKGVEAPSIDPEYVPWAPIRKNIDHKTLNDDTDWLRASTQLYSMGSSKKFEGTNSELAEWGKNHMGWFEYNTVAMAAQAGDIARIGTKEDKEAFLYMMRTYPNTNHSWAGTGRFLRSVVTDPLTYASIETFGLGKVAAKIAAKKALEITLLKALGRTGLVGGVVGGIQGGARDAITQNAEINVGARKEFSNAEFAGVTAASAAVGIVLGTALDFGLSQGRVILGTGKDWVADKFTKIFNEYGIKGKPTGTPHVDPTGTPHVDPTGTPHVDPAAPSSTKPDVTPPAESAAPPVASTVSESLPKELAGAKPRWKTSTIEFESDLDKALFITSQKTKSKADGQYRDWLKAQGLDDAQIDALGKQVRAALKEAIPEEGNVLRIKRVSPTREGTTLNEGLNLKVGEEKSALARRQAGRLPEDNIVPSVTGGIIKLSVPTMNTGLRSTTPTNFDLSGAAKTLAAELQRLVPEDLAKAMEQLRTNQAGYSYEEHRVVALGVKLVRDQKILVLAKLEKALGLEKDPLRALALQKQIDEHLAIYKPLYLADDAMASFTGSSLNDRKYGSSVKETVDSLMAEHPQMSRDEANAALVKMMEDEIQAKDAQKLLDDFADEYDKALLQGDLEKAGDIASKKFAHMQSLAEEAVKGGAGFWRKLNELAISWVFTTTTLQVNIFSSAVKTMFLPLVRSYLNDPLQRATRVELMATYSGMLSTLKWGRQSAYAAAMAALRYEQALVTRDGMRLLESEMAWTGKKAGWLRFYPRILNASDEFLSHINYHGFVAGKAGSLAALSGLDKGLTGKAFDDHVKQAITKALEDAFVPETSEALIHPIVLKGENLGLRGAELSKYVAKEVKRTGTDPLRHGSDEEALELVRDQLYKRRPSGVGTASFLFKNYESIANGVPAWRFLCGQLFIRTPIRVFEEGFRITPALNLLAPNFVADLAGKNGVARMLRAKTEAAVSLALTGMVFNLVSQGRITGDGAYSDYQLARAGDSSPRPPKYSVRMDDGTYWVFKGIDPIATPMRILVNAIERLDNLHIRHAQGEDIPENVFEGIGQYFMVGLTAVAMAFKDANLVAGISNGVENATMLWDSKNSDSAALKLFGDKVSLLFPKQITKVAKDKDSRMKDPATYLQMVETKLDPFSLIELGLDASGHHQKGLKSSYAYDVLGNVKTMTDSGALWNIFSTTSQKELNKGRSPSELYVLTELDRLSKETGASFKPPLRHAELGTLDLRTIETKDGTQTLYDKWQTNYKDLDPATAIEPILRAPVPDGTNLYKGLRVELVQGTLHELQEAAFKLLMAQESEVVNAYRDQIINQTHGKFGFRDNPRPNHN